MLHFLTLVRDDKWGCKSLQRSWFRFPSQQPSPLICHLCEYSDSRGQFQRLNSASVVKDDKGGCHGGAKANLLWMTSFSAWQENWTVFLLDFGLCMFENKIAEGKVCAAHQCISADLGEGGGIWNTLLCLKKTQKNPADTESNQPSWEVID